MSEAARRLGVSESTVSRMLAKGTLTGQRFGNRVWAIPESEIERIKALPRPKPGRKVGTPMPKRYQGTCVACGQPFSTSRPARFCSARCSARFRARERTARR
jgi:excisionase family DNA binding protein